MKPKLYPLKVEPPTRILETSKLNSELNAAIAIEKAIDDFQTKMKEAGKTKETIIARIRNLKQVAKYCNILNPDHVKTWLASENLCRWRNSTKNKFIDTYNQFLKSQNITWHPPSYKACERVPFVPTEQELDILISGCGKKTATVLQTLKETGMRIGELTQLKWTDLDTERRTLSVTPEKNSNPRLVKISDKLLNMINQLPRSKETIFHSKKNDLRTYFCIQRKAIAEKMQNPRLLKISFHTFRHWKGTMEYHKTKDIMHVKYILGHKTIECTLIYINRVCIIPFRHRRMDC